MPKFTAEALRWCILLFACFTKKDGIEEFEAN